MKILSWDVGIYNLAYCLIEICENKIKIIDWNIINLRKDHINQNILICEEKTNGKNKICKNKAKYTHKSSNKHYCLRHTKMCSKKTKCNINEIFREIKIKKKKKTKINIQELSKKLILELDNFPNFLNMDYILIENQPVLKNPVMKSVQMVLYSYFLIKGIVKNTIKEIKFISARNKLKVYDGPAIEVKVKGKYAKRKRLSIEYCKYMIKNDNKNLIFFNKHKKKDDLADCYLQAMWFLKKNNMI